MQSIENSISKFQQLSKADGVILPSLLACDFANLERDIHELEQAGAQGLHLDIMDGHFVPNLSFGIPVVEAVRRVTDLVLDVHLMLSNPQDYFEVFKKAGADGITFHIEALADQEISGRNFARKGCSLQDVQGMPGLTDRVETALRKIRGLNCACGLSLIPPTDVSILKPYLSECENVLVMSVMPGFGGQKFDPNAREKLAWLRENAPKSMLRSVDGGVNESTLSDCCSSGGTGLVMGTAIFKGNRIQERFAELNAQIHPAN